MATIASIDWCCKQRDGIRLIEPNENLAKEYFSTAEETLITLKAITSSPSKVWLAVTKYYCEYFSIYALLMKLGIESEIHECTIAVCSFLENEGLLPAGTRQRLKEDKQLRVDNQYYLKNRPVNLNYDDLVSFVINMKNIAEKITFQKAKDIREKLEKMIAQNKKKA